MTCRLEVAAIAISFPMLVQAWRRKKKQEELSIRSEPPSFFLATPSMELWSEVVCAIAIGILSCLLLAGITYYGRLCGESITSWILWHSKGSSDFVTVTDDEIATAFKTLDTSGKGELNPMQVRVGWKMRLRMNSSLTPDTRLFVGMVKVLERAAHVWSVAAREEQSVQGDDVVRLRLTHNAL